MEEEFYSLIDELRLADKIDYNEYIDLHDMIGELAEESFIKGMQEYKIDMKKKLFFGYRFEEEKPVNFFYDLLDEIDIKKKKEND